MKLVHKILTCQVDRVDQEDRTFWAVASTAGGDRMGDEIVAAGWVLDNFLKNPVIPWAHDYERPPVAKALAVRIEGESLVFQAQFPLPEEYAFADTIFRLYRGGYLRAFSVGFLPLESQRIESLRAGRKLAGQRYLKQELYEISCVTLPANPDALVALAHPGVRPALPPTPAATPAPAGPAPAGLLLDRLIARRLLRQL